MSSYHKPLFVCLALAAAPLVSGAALAESPQRQSPWPTDVAVETPAGQTIPAGAQGVVLIDSPREATLLMLRGMSGSGDAILRDADNRDCLTTPIRFVAGDFGGNSITAHTAKPIRLILRSVRVARALANGQDIVSDMYRVGSARNDPEADIIIESGLSDSHGFVLNPGSSILADIFGADIRRTPCSAL